jgi:hypothetical protein
LRHAVPLAAAAVYLACAIGLGKRIAALREKETGSRNSTGERE